MDHIEILTRASKVTWRYRALWVFGFFLALCSGGSGGSGSGNGDISNVFNSSGGGSPDMPFDMSSPDLTIIFMVIAGVCGLILFFILLGMFVSLVCRTALIGMVKQAEDTQSVTVADGWSFGYSRRALRLLGVDLLIGIPVAIISISLILMAMSPLLFIALEDTFFLVLGVGLMIMALLFVMLLLLIMNVFITPLQEMAGRQTVLAEHSVIDSIFEGYAILQARMKDLVIMWVFMLIVSIAWGIISLFIILPASIMVMLVTAESLAV